MKRLHIIAFLFGTIAVLAVICAVFPEDGLQIGGLGLRFPGLQEIMVGDEPASDEPSPEELLAQRQKAAAAAEKAEYERFFREDPARFCLPDSNCAYFDRFFESLENAGTEPMRIVHYGDSQIEEDRISCVIREGLQSRFGGGGPGMLPLGSYHTLTMGESSTGGLRPFMIYGDASRRSSNKRYGPMARFSRIDTTVTVTLRSAMTRTKPALPRTSFSRVTLVAGNIRGKMYVSCLGDKRVVEPDGNPVTKVTFAVPDSSTKVSFSVRGHADLYGVMLDDSTGVSLDNVPMRGCSGTIFTKLNADVLQTYYSGERVRMIMLQYGGNSVPYIKTPKAMSTYKKGIMEQIKLFQEIAPDATLVFMGPSDMSTTIKGRRQTYPHLPAFIDTLKTAAAESGIAYWDIYGAMGGENSMVQWVNSKPALAGPDYIHFTPLGAEQMGKLFISSLMLYYDYYDWRKRNDEE